MKSKEQRIYKINILHSEFKVGLLSISTTLDDHVVEACLLSVVEVKQLDQQRADALKKLEELLGWK